MPTFTEKSAVEDYIVEKLVEKGWKFVPADQLERESYEEPLLVKDLARAIKRINREFELTEGDISRVLIELKHRTASAEGCKQILRFLKQGIAIKLEKSKDLRYVQLFDYNNIENNEFIVSRQVSYERGREKIRPDIVLYVNGIPLVFIECKNPVDPSVSWGDAYYQIKEYEKKVPEPFKYAQFSIAAEETARYFPNSPWREGARTYIWRAGEFDILNATLEMLSKDVLLDLVKNFIFIREERGATKKVIARYMQYRATNKIYERVIRNIKGEEKKKKGLVWHWQGSGKTLTMIFAAHKLYREELLGNPTIFFILDRLDLEEQLTQELNSLDIGFKPEPISSIRELKSVLVHDGGRGKRGIFVTLVHKFRPGEISRFEEELSKIREKETISTRENVICFVDEGHRTQYGTLAAQMRNILKNAFFFAFTGTPIAKKGRDTFREFSYPEEGENYLDKYFMLDSIKDNFTVKILYQPRMERKVHLRKELLEFFLEQELEEIPEEFRTEVEKKIKKKIGIIRLRMKHPKRIEIISRDIAEHFKHNVDGKFKAMVVAVDREACVMYKRMLDKFLPPEYSEIVMTFNTKRDPKKITNYLKELIEKYGSRDVEEIRKEIIERFKQEDEYPRILIVTDMLITGFDAPILQTMYLDKPLKEHRLIQAIARTNRPYRGLKEAGVIIDYVGIFKELEKALAVYNKEDVEHVAYNVEEEERRFEEIIEKLLGFFEGVNKESTEREELMKAVSVLARDEKKAKSFRRGYRELRKIFELIGPHPLKLKHLEMYKWLTAVYHVYNRHVKRVDPDETERYARKYFSKTIENIYKSIDIDKIKRNFPILYFDDKYIEKLEKLYPDLESRVSDMIFTLNKYILVDKSRSPVYESIADKVERIVEAWKERKVSIKVLYEQTKAIFQEINFLNKRQRELGLSNMEYHMLTILEKSLGSSAHLVNDVKELSKKLRKVMFKGWSVQPSTVKDVGIIVRRYLRKQKISKEKRDELYEKIIKMLKELD
ncbi:HsdR family type I site-specific deoxyribonuclease [Candidatus Bathyarchaeota archaeon]|nr:HsdR family type I site-specific deoxyribonuclease [Candidatus Bathyarchaeota archaeon]